MTTFRYRALTPNGEVASGSISAPTAAEVSQRVEYLGLIPIETVRDEGGTGGARWDFTILSRPRPEDVTVFTGDLAPLLQTGARINDALELLSADADIGRLRPTAAKLTAAILSGESFADALARHPALFPPMYVELARVGEASARWSIYWEVLGAERARAEALRRRFTDACSACYRGRSVRAPAGAWCNCRGTSPFMRSSPINAADVPAGRQSSSFRLGCPAAARFSSRGPARATKSASLG